MELKLQKEHAWLQKLVGHWTYETEIPMEGGAPPMKFSGTETIRAIGDAWIQGEGVCHMPDGATDTTMLTLGFDERKGKFVGTWFGSMMTNIWNYLGTLDVDEKVLTLDTEGPNCMVEATAGESKLYKFKEVIEMKSSDHRQFSSSMLGDDGQWKTLLVSQYHRAK